MPELRREELMLKNKMENYIIIDNGLFNRNTIKKLRYYDIRFTPNTLKSKCANAALRA